MQGVSRLSLFLQKVVETNRGYARTGVESIPQHYLAAVCARRLGVFKLHSEMFVQAQVLKCLWIVFS